MSANKKRCGFTVAELAVVAGLISLVSLLLSLMMSTCLKQYRFAQNQIKMQDSIAAGIRDFESKVRGAEQIITAAQDEFVFYAYIANDTRPAPSRIRYFIQDNQLFRGVISPEGAGPNFQYPEESEVLKSVSKAVLNSNQLFTYYNDNDYNYADDSATLLAEPIDLARVRMVRITLTVDFDVANSPVSAEQTTLVNLRNLKRNL